MTDLATQLAASVEALSTGGRFVAAFELPSDADLNAVHAELEREIRRPRVMRCYRVMPMPEGA